MTVIIPPQQVIPAASLTAGHMTFVPVPAHLKPWLHSVWQSEYATHTALSTERCYPDGGHSLTFSVDDACYDATVLFGTKTGNLSKFNRPSAVSFRFHPGAFSECFGIKAESVPQNTDIPLSALFQEPLPPPEALCGQPLPQVYAVLTDWLTLQIHRHSNNTQQRLKLTEALVTSSYLAGAQNIETLFGCSTRTLQRKCKQALGLAPKEMLMFGKIYLARKSLIYSNAPLSDIALSSGYFDQAHFTNHFRDFVGETPARYRQRKQKNNP
ncbi:helix-turn-helix domain-containing protein [Alteromonas sp. RKMC-009]|uniref:helix-turn-helix domain-containing protein n=1 Tax=Alteromonas sp. RKMC-009 TaxID=2267264 RepID=UPI000E683A48|nr:helix-turn-helix domain-containing protein [Alteromonas sp. RKMC-009]AYA63047.1 AraC family transcriptional regulator [Alteromonas sp. RKMC-009]